MPWSLPQLPSRSLSVRSKKSKRASSVATAVTALGPVPESDHVVLGDDDTLPPLPPAAPAEDDAHVLSPTADMHETSTLPALGTTDQSSLVLSAMKTPDPDSPTIVSSKVSTKTGLESTDIPLDAALDQDVAHSSSLMESVAPSAEDVPVTASSALDNNISTPIRAPSSASRTTTKAKLLPLHRQPSSAAASVAPSQSLEDLVSTLFLSARAANIRTDDPPPSLSNTPHLGATALPRAAPDVDAYLPPERRHPSTTAATSTQVTTDPASGRRTTVRSASLSRHGGSTHSIVLVSSSGTGEDTPSTLAHTSSPTTHMSSALMPDHIPGAGAAAAASGMVVRAAIDAVEHRVAARCAVLEADNAALKEQVDRLERGARKHQAVLNELSARVAMLLDAPPPEHSGEVRSLGRHAGQHVASALKSPAAAGQAESGGRPRTGSVGSLGLRGGETGNRRKGGDGASVRGYATPKTVNGAMEFEGAQTEEEERKEKEREKAAKKKNRFRSWF